MPSSVVFTNAMIITATDAPPLVGAVVVENELIADVIDGVPRRTGRSQLVDLAGQSLLPGLIDAHVHITAVDVDITNQHRHRFESEIAVLGARSLTEMLERGFTTVRDAGGADAGFRRALEHGQLAGPRLLVSGRPLSQTGGHGDQRLASEYSDAQNHVPHVGLIHAIADGPDEVRRAAREELRRGANQIKVMASGGVMSPTDRLASVQYTVEELRAAVQAAESVGTYVMAHAYTPESISRCVVAGVHSIEHGNLLDEATAKLMADRNVFLVPTLVAYEKLRDEGPAHDLARENLNKLGDVLDAGLQSLRIALDAGVRIASGSDLLGPLRRFQGEEIEIKSRVLGPLAAITATTRTNAELLGLENEIGTIEPGKRADLLVVNGDVLDDPSLVGDPEHVSLVLQGGRFSVNHLP